MYKDEKDFVISIGSDTLPGIDLNVSPSIDFATVRGSVVQEPHVFTKIAESSAELFLACAKALRRLKALNKEVGATMEAGNSEAIHALEDAIGRSVALEIEDC